MELQSDFNKINHLLVSDDKIEIAFTENSPMTGGKKCPSGQIERKGYHRQAYSRKDGTQVSEAYVSPACIEDRGNPGKGPYTLPRPDEEISLRQYGYSVHDSDKKRQEALNRASKATDTLLVYRHLNLLRNYQADSSAKTTMSKDVEFMKKKYQQIRENKGPSRRSYTEREQFGGFSETSPMAPSCGQYGGQLEFEEEEYDSENMDGGYSQAGGEHEEELYKIFAKAREYRERMMKGGQDGEKKKRGRNPLLMVAIGLAKDLKKIDKYSNIKWTQLVKFANQVLRDTKKLLDIADKKSVDDADIINIEKKAQDLIHDDKYMRDLIQLDKQLEKHEEEPSRVRIMRGGMDNVNFY